MALVNDDEFLLRWWRRYENTVELAQHDYNVNHGGRCGWMSYKLLLNMKGPLTVLECVHHC